MQINLALNYGSKFELINAFKNLTKKKEKISINNLSKNLLTKNIPDPDFLIRTGNTKRLSNFLLWQSAYTELYMTDKFWPDFREDELLHSILDYQTRQRRYGQTSEQVSE